MDLLNGHCAVCTTTSAKKVQHPIRRLKQTPGTSEASNIFMKNHQIHVVCLLFVVSLKCVHIRRPFLFFLS